MQLKDLLLPFKAKKIQPQGTFSIHFVKEGITYAEIEWIAKKPVIKRCGLIQTTFGPVEILRELSSLVKKYAYHGYVCNWVLQPKDYNLISIPDLPVSSDELSTALKFHIKDQIDFPVMEAVIDYFKVPYLTKAQNEELIYVVVARKNYIDLVAKLIVESELVLNVIDIPEFAVRNIAEFYAEPGDSIGVIECSSAGVRLSIMVDGFVYVVRKIDVDFNQTLSDDEFHIVVTEVQRSCDYYENGLGQKPVTQFLLVSPDGSLASKLTDRLSVPVEYINISNKLESTADLTPEKLQQCLYAIGGGLRREEKGVQ